MTTALVLLAVQGALGAFDTLYYHEWLLRLPSRPHAALELTLHAVRDYVYVAIFCTLGRYEWNGMLGWLLLALLAFEIVLTLGDFGDDDRTRKLPPGARSA